MQYAKHVSTKTTPQSEPIPGKPMVPNNAGGFTFAVDMRQRLDRFLILGSEGGSYYVSEKKLTQENAGGVIECIKADGKRTVDRIVEVSIAGRAPKNDPAIFALALAATYGDEATKRAAFGAVSSVCRIGTHLFQFASACDELRGWGRGLRRAIGNWYTSKAPDDLAYQAIKYQSRNGWSHRDLLRLAHPVIKETDPLQAVLRWIVKGTEDLGSRIVKRHKDEEELGRTYSAVGELPSVIQAFEVIKKSTSIHEVVDLIHEHNLPRECVPTQFLNEPEVWGALLEKMPLTAMIRNLGNMTKIGLLTPLSSAEQKVRLELLNIEKLKKARVHPLSILIAMKTYAQGHGMKGSGTWSPVQNVVDTLNEAFYLAFDAVEPSNKRWMLGIDVSASMGAGVAGSPVTCCEAATALALVTNRVEPYTFVGRFNVGLESVPFGRGTRLDDALTYTRNINGGGTDCSLPMVFARENNLLVDTFCVLTDSETWAGREHPVQALKKYRDKTGIPAKLIVVGMVSNGFTIADPSDPGMLDVVGFDTSVPAVMADFARG